MADPTAVPAGTLQHTHLGWQAHLPPIPDTKGRRGWRTITALEHTPNVTLVFVNHAETPHTFTPTEVIRIRPVD